MKQRLLKPDEVEQYRSLTSNYHPNGQVVVDFARSKFAVITGPTGAGKDTIRNELIKDPAFAKILSTTSRPKRDGEQDGVEYHFRDLKFFDKGMEEQRFLQVALVHDQQLSCLDFNDVTSLAPNQTALAILVVQTEAQLRKLNPDLKTIFVIPPNYEVLIQRMNQNRQLSEDEQARRLAGAKVELGIALKETNYYCIVNDDLAKTVELSRSFFLNGITDTVLDQTARQIMTDILNRLQ